MAWLRNHWFRGLHGLILSFGIGSYLAWLFCVFGFAPQYFLWYHSYWHQVHLFKEWFWFKAFIGWIPERCPSHWHSTITSAIPIVVSQCCLPISILLYSQLSYLLAATNFSEVWSRRSGTLPAMEAATGWLCHPQLHWMYRLRPRSSHRTIFGRRPYLLRLKPPFVSW